MKSAVLTSHGSVSVLKKEEELMDSKMYYNGDLYVNLSTESSSNIKRRHLELCSNEIRIWSSESTLNFSDHKSIRLTIFSYFYYYNEVMVIVSDRMNIRIYPESGRNELMNLQRGFYLLKFELETLSALYTLDNVDSLTFDFEYKEFEGKALCLFSASEGDDEENWNEVIISAKQGYELMIYNVVTDEKFQMYVSSCLFYYRTNHVIITGDLQSKDSRGCTLLIKHDNPTVLGKLIIAIDRCRGKSLFLNKRMLEKDDRYILRLFMTKLSFLDLEDINADGVFEEVIERYDEALRNKVNRETEEEKSVSNSETRSEVRETNINNFGLSSNSLFMQEFGLKNPLESTGLSEETKALIKKEIKRRTLKLFRKYEKILHGML